MLEVMHPPPFLSLLSEHEGARTCYALQHTRRHVTAREVSQRARVASLKVDSYRTATQVCKAWKQRQGGVVPGGCGVLMEGAHSNTRPRSLVLKATGVFEYTASQLGARTVVRGLRKSPPQKSMVKSQSW